MTKIFRPIVPSSRKSNYALDNPKANLLIIRTPNGESPDYEINSGVATFYYPKQIRVGSRFPMEIVEVEDTSKEIKNTQKPLVAEVKVESMAVSNLINPKSIIAKKPEEKPKKKKIQVPKVWRDIQNKNVEKFEDLKTDIIKADALKPNTNGLEVLTIDDVGYTRSLGIIQILLDLENIEGKLYKKYQLISAMGNNSIIALAIAGGIPMRELMHWWSTEWIKIFKPHALKTLLRGTKLAATFADRKTISRKHARKVLAKFFSKTNHKDHYLTFEDLRTEVYIPVINANKQSFPYTKETAGNIPLVQAVLDSLDPIEFDSEENIKGKPVHLGGISKSPDLFIGGKNKNAKITSIGTGGRIHDHGSLKNPSSEKLVHLNRDKEDFKDDLLRHIHLDEKSYRRITCKRIDDTKRNSTRPDAISKAINSGKGRVNV